MILKYKDLEREGLHCRVVKGGLELELEEEPQNELLKIELICICIQEAIMRGMINEKG